MMKSPATRSESFADSDDKILSDFNNSLGFDKQLFRADIKVSLVYTEGLFHAGILTRLEAEKIKNGLLTLQKRADFDKNYFETDLPDVHSFIEAKLIQLIGETGKKLNTGRHRNEQVSTAFRLWLREEISEISATAEKLQKTLLDEGQKNKEAVIAGYANLKKIQPILWTHFCLAYFEMLLRDRERLDEVWRRTNILPLGVEALGGTSLEIDREELAQNLGFEGITANSLDTVADRDFAVEFVGVSALLMIHLSRLATDLLLYSSEEFGFLSFSLNKVSASLELLRGKASRLCGHQTALLTTLKGLPMSYSHDLDEDKEIVFDTVETVKNCLQIARIALKNLQFNSEKTLISVTENNLNVLELTTYLIEQGLPAISARQLVEKICDYADSRQLKPQDLKLEELQKFSPLISEDVYQKLELEHKLAGKNQIGGTSPERVYEALEEAQKMLKNQKNG